MNKYNSSNIISIELLDKYFLINWHVTGWCNYHCPYCINRPFEGKYIPEDKVIELAQHMNSFILNQIPTNMKVQLRLIGGEPSFYNWRKILDNFDRLDRITMITNFSKNNEFFQDLYNYCVERHIFFYLICSYHEENRDFTDKVIDLQRWVRETHERRMTMQSPQVMLLADKNFSEQTLQPYIDANIRKLRLSILRDENQNHIELTEDQLKLIQDWNNKYEETTKKTYIDKGWAGKKGFKVTFNDGSVEYFANQSHLTNLMDEGFNPDGFECTSGEDTLTCLPNGDVTLNKCDALKDKVIGNFLKDDVVYLHSSVICTLNCKGENKKCPLCFGTSVYRKEE